MQKSLSKKVLARNKRARYDYEISETFIAGIVLKGYEVKSVRAGQVNFRDSFVRVENGEAWLVNAHISLWRFARVKDYDPRARRKLLLTKKEIHELLILQEGKGMSIIPLELFVQGRRLKLRIGVGKGRRKYDKRAKLRARELKKQVKEELANIKRF